MITAEQVQEARTLVLEAVQNRGSELFQAFQLFDHLNQTAGLNDRLIRRAFWELVGESQIILQPNSRVRLATLSK